MTSTAEILGLMAGTRLNGAGSPLGSGILADYLEESGHPGIADRLRLSLAFPDAMIAFPKPMRLGPFRHLWGVAGGEFILHHDHLRRLPRDQTLDRLAGCLLIRPGRDWTVPDFGHLEGRPLLRFRRVVIDHAAFHDLNLRQLLGCTCFQAVEALELRRNRVWLRHFRTFGHRAMLGALRTLCWRADFLSLRGLEEVLTKRFFHSLSALSLRSPIGAPHLPGPMALEPALGALNQLDLDIPGITSDDMEALSGSPALPGLASLALKVPVDPPRGWLLPILEVSGKLKSVGLRGHLGCPGHVVAPLFDFLRAGNPPESLSLEGIPLGGDQIGDLANWAASGKLRQLRLVECQVSPAGAAIIGGKVLPFLEQLAFQPQSWHPAIGRVILSRGSETLRDLDLVGTDPQGAQLGSWLPPGHYPRLARLRWSTPGSRGVGRFLAAAPQVRIFNGRFID